EELTSSMNTDAGKVAKVQVVGNEKTVKAINEYMAEIGSASLDLMLNRIELVFRKNSIQTSESLREKKRQEIDKYIEIMKNLNLEGNYDKHLWDIVKRNIAFEQEQYAKY